MIRDKIVFSIAPEEKAPKERLLRHENLTLTKTRDLCVVFEVTQNEVRSLSTHDREGCQLRKKMSCEARYKVYSLLSA